jgi:hypothetical protein
MRPWRQYKDTPFLLVKDARQSLFRRGQYDRTKLVCFVAGVQRSGTEMLMAAFDRHPDTYVFHERDPRAYEDYEMRAVSRMRELVNGVAPTVVIVKALCESQDLSRLLDAFDDARAIWMYRDFRDVINSNLRSQTFRFAGRNYIDEVVQDPQRGGWRGRGMTAETLAAIRAEYSPDISNDTALALFWYYRNMLFFDQNLDQDDRCLLLNYERLVADPGTLGARVQEFARLPADTGIFSHVHGGSLKKNEPPAVTPGAETLCRDLMARLDRVCAEKTARRTA